MVALLGGLIGATPVGAQTQQTLPTRDEYVFHVNVDPLRGDDVLASTQNPPLVATPTSPLTPLSLHPDLGDPSDLLPIAGVLQQAPFSFKTLTAAVAYGRQFVGFTKVFGPRRLRIRHVLIHCLPGLYGPFDPLNPTLPRIDPQSGLPFNGETWPVTIPSFVSIQGTSALDTIFDGRLGMPHILAVTDPNATSVSHEESFIDSVTIRNARSSPTSTGYGTGAGIYIYSTSPIFLPAICKITITNCFITSNRVGIGVDSYDFPSPVTHKPRIINNTIAWNAIGLWSGNTRLMGATSINQLLLLNNIFDSTSPVGIEWGSPAALASKACATRKLRSHCAAKCRSTHPRTSTRGRMTSPAFPIGVSIWAGRPPSSQLGQSRSLLGLSPRHGSTFHLTPRGWPVPVGALSTSTTRSAAR